MRSGVEERRHRYRLGHASSSRRRLRAFLPGRRVEYYSVNVVLIGRKGRGNGMLFIVNGSPKTGTTWVMKILKAQPWIQDTPAQYNKKDWTNPSLTNESLMNIEDHDFYNKEHFVTKVHLTNEYWALKLMDVQNVCVISIIRDARDQFVSRFYHDRRRNIIPAKMSFDMYFKKFATKRIQQLSAYNKLWYVKTRRVPITLSYEYLKHDFESAINFFSRDLRLPSGVYIDIEKTKHKTDFSNLSNTGYKKFLRKGLVGDHKNHMSEGQIKQFNARLRKNGYLEAKQRISMLFPHLQPYLNKTDIGLEV